MVAGNMHSRLFHCSNVSKSNLLGKRVRMAEKYAVFMSSFKFRVNYPLYLDVSLNFPAMFALL